MGTWLGHAAPGSFFIVYSLWWTVRTFQEIFRLKGNYVNTLGKTCPCCCGRLKDLPMEGISLVITAIVGWIGETVTGSQTEHFPLVNWQHCTMYTAFGLVGIVQILVHFKTKFIPQGLDYLACMMALLVEVVLFVFHLHGRSMLDTHIHQLLVYTIALTVPAVAAEMYFKKSTKAAVARNFLFMLQGTWFMQIGFTLYNPLHHEEMRLTRNDTTVNTPMHNMSEISSTEEVDQMMIITMIFAWHIMAIAVGNILVAALIYWCSTKCGRSDDNDLPLLPKTRRVTKASQERTQLLATNGHAVLEDHSSEEDVLF